MKKVSLIVMILFGFASSNLFAQIENANRLFKIKSLEGNECSVKVKLDYVNDKIMISLNSSESLCIQGFRGLAKDINVLNKKFIELQFDVRGGSGVQFRRYALVCVSDNKLYEAMDIISMVHSDIIKTDTIAGSHKLYHLEDIYGLKNIKITRSKKDFRLTAIEYHSEESKYAPNHNRETQHSIKLSFDLKHNIFYNKIGYLNGNYNLIGYNLGNILGTQTFKNKTVPVINLKLGVYYYINKSWFQKSGKNVLVEYSSFCE